MTKPLRFTASGYGTAVTSNTEAEAADFFRAYIGREPESVEPLTIPTPKPPAPRDQHGEHDDTLRQMAAEGHTLGEMARVTGLHRHTAVSARLDKLGILDDWRVARQAHRSRHDALIARMAAEGRVVDDIKAATGMGERAIRDTMDRLGIREAWQGKIRARSRAHAIRREVDPQELAAHVAASRGGEATIAEIAAAVGKRPAAARTYCRRHKIPYRTRTG